MVGMEMRVLMRGNREGRGKDRRGDEGKRPGVGE